MQGQLDAVDAEIHLALETRHAELSARLTNDTTRQT